MSASDSYPIYLSRRAATRPLRAAAAGLAMTAVGLAVGVATFYGQGRLHGPASALANSQSAWLVAPLAVGALPRDRRLAALAGLVTCLAQLVGYDVDAHLRGFALDVSTDAFWALAAVVAGPLFGLAGRTWRHGAPGVRGLGPAALASAFAGEGLWVYLHTLREPATATLWLAIAAAVAGVGLRGVQGWRWLLLTLPLAWLVEFLVTQGPPGRAW